MKDILLKYNQMVPRYTSYPTAPHFSDMPSARAEEWLRGLPPEKPVSLYVHVPFCREMCWYCGCHTTATQQYKPVADYIDLLQQEILLVREVIGFSPSVSHLHFGGGSPSMLSGEDFGWLMSSLGLHFQMAEGAEIAIEADPRGVTSEKTAAYGRCGVNRASFGIQDFTPDVQRSINRVQDFDMVKSAAGLVRSAGIEKLNFDLMYGLPLQTVGKLLQTVELSLRLQPQRISLFGYAHVPWMKKHMRLIRDEDLPDAAARIDQFEAAAERLQAEGFVPVGIDHFVREDDEMAVALRNQKLARNFQGYTTDDAAAMIGFGASSIGRYGGGYVQNAANIVSYRDFLAKGVLPVSRGIALSEEDRARAEIVSDLMCYFEADIEKTLRRHSFPVAHLDAELDSLLDLEKDGCVLRQGRFIILNPQFRQLARVVASRFDAYFVQNRKRHVQAV